MADAGGSRARPARRLPVPDQSRGRVVIGATWIAVILLSAVPAILTQTLRGVVPWWLVLAQAGVVTALLLSTALVPRLRPLWRYGVVAGALLLLSWASAQIDFGMPLMRAALGHTLFDDRMQAEQSGRLVVAIGMIAVLLLLRMKPREFFLTMGDLTAPIRPVPLLGFPKPDSWRRFGLIWGFGIAAALAVVQILITRPTPSQWQDIVPMLPSILVYAAMNSFSEEMTYRAPMLATLAPVVGATQALWLAAVSFGVAHYFGIPGGLLGATASIFMGWILSKAMLETRGLFWAWWIHFLSDVVIFGFVALALVA